MNKEEFCNKVNEIKEVLSNMPQNNKSNKVKYIEYIDNQLRNNNNLKDELIKEINKRYEEISLKVKCEDINIEQLNKDKAKLFDSLWIIDDCNSSYEKIGLDKSIFNISRYYEDNINSLNKEIRNVIKCFYDVGIKLTINDFYYSFYLKDYMNLILNSDDEIKIKEKFDQIYWKCPNIINQICMNFASLYYKNEKIFNEYFNKKKDTIISNDGKKELVSKYNVILDNIDNDYYSIENISKRFLNGEDNIKDFSLDKYKSYIDSICDGDVDTSNLDKLNNTLFEYSVYLKYKFIVDQVINIYKEKDKHKNTFKNLKNEILKEEKKIIKINKKIEFQNKWGKNHDKIEILNINLNTVIDGLKEKYDGLEIVKVNEILSNSSDNLSYFDILKIVSTHYIYLRDILIKDDEGIDDSKINEIQSEIFNFLNINKLTFLDNVFVLDNVNLSSIISNKYKLFNMKINENDIESNVDNLIELLRKIRIINVINNSSVSYEDLLFLVESLSIIKS